MTKKTLMILALCCASPAFAAPDTEITVAGLGLSLSSPVSAATRPKLNPASPEGALSKALDVSAEAQEDADLEAQAAEAFELKLPEQELPESDIPLTFNSKVSYFIRYFQESGRGSFSRWLSRSERYIPMMRTVLKKEGLPEDLVYLAMIESGFSPHAYSVASAVGPWQFMSATGKRYALRINPWIDERRDPVKSTVAAALYLKELYALFNNDWYLAAAGYNAGENKILRAISMYNSRDFWELSKGEYLKRETKDYVPKLLAAAIIAKEPAKYGFADVAYLPPIEVDLVQIPQRTDLEVVAKACGVSLQTIRELNPELRRFSTPPDYPDYQLKIPKGKREQFEAEYAKVPENERYHERVRMARHRVKKGETLASIAARYQSTPQAIAELNHLGKKSRSLRGKLLTVPIPVPAADAESPAQEKGSAPETAVAKAKTKENDFIRYYVVKKGDTLASLAKRFNVTAKVLSAWNNLKTRVALKPGRRIIVAKFQEKNGAMVKG